MICACGERARNCAVQFMKTFVRDGKFPPDDLLREHQLPVASSLRQPLPSGTMTSTPTSEAGPSSSLTPPPFINKHPSSLSLPQEITRRPDPAVVDLGLQPLDLVPPTCSSCASYMISALPPHHSKTQPLSTASPHPLSPHHHPYWSLTQRTLTNTPHCFLLTLQCVVNIGVRSFKPINSESHGPSRNIGCGGLHSGGVVSRQGIRG